MQNKYQKTDIGVTAPAVPERVSVALDAETELTALATELNRTHPGAAASLREGMAETLTVLRR